MVVSALGVFVILGLFALAVFFLTILIAVIKIGPAGFSEAARIYPIFPK